MSLWDYKILLNRKWNCAHQLVIWIRPVQNNGQCTEKSPALLDWQIAWMLQAEPFCSDERDSLGLPFLKLSFVARQYC